MDEGYELRLSVTGAAVHGAPGQSVLDAFLRRNVWLPNSCNQGTCGTCKVRVVAGVVDHRESPEYTLSEEERSAGFALACQAHPRSDLVVEPAGYDAADGVTRFPLRDYAGTLAGLEDVARDVRRVTIELDRDLGFLPGQYIELQVPGHGAGEIWRQYSIANPPVASPRIELHVKRSPGGLASESWLFGSARAGDPVALRGPRGDFVLDRPEPEPAVFLAGGTGLSGVSSMIRHALEWDWLPELHLYHGVSTPDELYDVQLFTTLARRYERFRYTPCVSRVSWPGRTGRVSDVVAEDFVSLRGYRGYLCGPPAMVDAGATAFKKRRMSPSRIRREKFIENDAPVTAPA